MKGVLYIIKPLGHFSGCHWPVSEVPVRGTRVLMPCLKSCGCCVWDVWHFIDSLGQPQADLEEQAYRDQTTGEELTTLAEHVRFKRAEW